MTTCLVTGGAGFIGASLVKYLLRETDWRVIVWDSGTYAARKFERLNDVKCPGRFALLGIDIRQAPVPDGVDYIVHMAAETHVDRSIVDSTDFISTNIGGTWHMLEVARRCEGLKKFLYFSTDEVFGPAMGPPFWEWDRYSSSNPYSATKAAGEELALAWANTYGLPVVISHCANAFGEDQHEEKFIPMLVRKILKDEIVPIHVDESGLSGSRMYVHTNDIARAIHVMLERGMIRQKYNIPGVSVSNHTMAYLVANTLERTLKKEEITPFKDRPGWDFSYSIRGINLEHLGWKPTSDIFPQLTDVIKKEARKYVHDQTNYIEK